MQTTLRIDDQLYREVKAEAARQGITMTKFLEEALRLRLKGSSEAVKNKEVHTFRVYEAGEPFPFTPEQIKRIDQEEQLKHDLAKLGIKHPET
ncbi:MAG: ribbon-helix-helix protein, CopG family [Candidatus Omnitrophica bacterium]|nr:ribbon-helix-helix protein, CopG family [Candidatus Omnitrophota bacterium]MCA9426380.1 ribbon-helix-helix protein, CopG family [Candidatus Omnitrophota bacterium]MCA9444377.1 ribbon-helix-helix protein, CopG family [Candidatus Omnitrophota bacterium]MCA9447001.1 ribbon-helix-helix protein, CopG family [Candidatus Omnitrophota bacterium]MCB9769633.1 ribbon-helix-helix protein, CopG family [Candidatus Omnitrophota bacterium]